MSLCAGPVRLDDSAESIGSTVLVEIDSGIAVAWSTWKEMQRIHTTQHAAMCTRITDGRGDRALYNKANGMTEKPMLHFASLSPYNCFSQLWNFHGRGSLPEGRLHSSMHEK